MTLQGYKATKAYTFRMILEENNKSEADQVEQMNDKKAKIKAHRLDAKLFQAKHPNDSANAELTNAKPIQLFKEPQWLKLDRNKTPKHKPGPRPNPLPRHTRLSTRPSRRTTPSPSPSRAKPPLATQDPCRTPHHQGQDAGGDHYANRAGGDSQGKCAEGADGS